MKKWTIGLLSAILALASCLCFAACGGKATEFAFKSAVPTQVQLSDEIYFRDYIEEEEGAKYKLYVSYTDPDTGSVVTERELSTLVFTFDKCTTYMFRLERNLDNKTASVSCEIKVLPPAPVFTDTTDVVVDKGDTRTLAELFLASGSTLTPFDLEDDIELLSLKMTRAAYQTTEQNPDLTEKTVDIAGKSSFTFDEEAIWKFEIQATNESGSDTAVITVRSYDVARSNEKVEVSYEAEAYRVSWAAVTGATGYRVWIDDEGAEDISATELNLSDREDGPVVLHILPIYGTTIYPASELAKNLYVGRDHSAIEISEEINAVVWEKRYFTKSYTVTENGRTYTYSKTDEADGLVKHVLKGDYETDDVVTVSVIATFDNDTSTEISSVELVFGNVTLGRIDMFATNATVKAVEKIDYVELEKGAGNSFVMVEFTGKNAPNVAVGAKRAAGALTLASGTTEWTDCGVILWNSLIGNRTGGLYKTNGFHSGSGAIDYAAADCWGTAGNGPGLANFDDDKHYVMIIGYEGAPTEDLPHRGIVTCRIFIAAEDGTLTQVTDLSTPYNVINHVAAQAGGTKVVLYGNVDPDGTGNSQKSVSFKYYTPAQTLNDVIWGMKDVNPYKEQLMTLLEIPEEPKVVGLSQTATLARMDLDSGTANKLKAANGIQFKEFNHSGDTFFITEFTGKNAPNFAVGATKGFNSVTAEGTAEFLPAGTMLWNSLIGNRWGGLYVTRGFHSGGSLNLVGDVTGAKDKGPGLGFFNDSAHYLMIVGYESMPEKAEAEKWALVTVRIYTVDEKGVLTEMANLSQEFKAVTQVSTGDKAVIYGNVDILGSTADPESVTFSYEAPASTLAALVNGLSDECTYKTQLATLCGLDQGA